MLVGQTPFHAETELAVYDKISARQFEIPENMDPDAADLIDKLL